MIPSWIFVGSELCLMITGFTFEYNQSSMRCAQELTDTGIENNNIVSFCQGALFSSSE